MDKLVAKLCKSMEYEILVTVLIDHLSDITDKYGFLSEARAWDQFDADFQAVIDSDAGPSEVLFAFRECLCQLAEAPLATDEQWDRFMSTALPVMTSALAGLRRF